MTILRLFVLFLAPVAAFVSTEQGRLFVGKSLRRNVRPEGTDHALSAAMIDADVWMASANSLLLSTVDADIAKLSDNEFAPIFAGGILVMFGGLLSAIFVGTVVEKNDLYASIVADSYTQESNDEEFWKNLSEQEKIKAEELLAKMRQNRNGGEPEKAVTKPSMAATVTAELTVKTTSATAVEDVKPQAIGMFSDYAEDS